MTVKENLLKIKSSIPSSVTLVAVSKTKPNELILEAHEAGQKDFGENYVQELVNKQKQLPNDINWHFIGHLQSNKVKLIAPFVYLIHGVDSLSLLKEIEKQGAKSKRVINCLLQIHISKEETKFGFSADDVIKLHQSGLVNQLNHVKIVGLMGMASNTKNQNQLKEEFDVIASVFKTLKKTTTKNFNVQFLSCGMSSDYKLAIEAGSNMIRIGSTIFGEREYTAKE
jgi:PLP dependent protein